MENIKNIANYEFIYKVNNFDYFFFYLLFNSEYFKWDFIFTNKNGEWKAYLSNVDLERLSKIGVKLMRSKSAFKEYRQQAESLKKESKLFYRKNRKIIFAQMQDKEIAKKIIEISHFVENLWSVYFFTELFCYGEVERMLENNIGTKKELKIIYANVKKMQKIKYDLRTEINKTIFGKHVFHSALAEISKRLKISQNKLHSLSYVEIVDCFKNKKYKTEDRKVYVAGKFNGRKLIRGRKSLRIINQLEIYKKEKTNILRGKTGNKGHYIGRVKIVPLDLKADIAREIKKMEKGDVLVSGSTGPEMILACKKAGAIVTEEGGITSHAAIISRELKIPSVIGTKIATEILKDGDLVEVDADKGVVKIIKKAK